MYSTPVHAVLKPRSEKLRLVNDHSAGTYSLNSMIARGDVVGAKMDSISDLMGVLLRYRKRHPKTTLILFKSDVSAAYWRLPLHPLWQVKQIVTIDGVVMLIDVLALVEGGLAEITLRLWVLCCG